MPNIYYYTCPIKDLYMMKEFGVKFECKDANGDVYDFQEWYLNSNNISELSLELENFPISIYVKKESEHIFDLKDGDLGIGYYRDLWEFGQGRWVFRTDEEYRTERDSFIKNIIKRDNKQFFYPEVVNE